VADTLPDSDVLLPSTQERSRTYAGEHKALCSQCSSRPREIGTFCAECKKKARRASKARSRAARRVRASHGSYDWVVVLNYYNGRKVDRELTSPEKVEVVRLILREGSVREHAERRGRPVQAVWDLVKSFEEQARAIGLDQPLRFCFLPEHELPADLDLV